MPSDSDQEVASGDLLESQLSLRIPRGLNERLNHYIPSGIKSEVIRLVLESLLRDFDKRGRVVIGEILDEHYIIKAGKGGGIEVEKR